MNPYLIIAAFIAIAAAGLGGFKLGVDHEVASQSREDQHIAQAVDAANTAAAQAIADIKVTHQVINQKVIHETTNNPVYRDCVNTDSGMRLINYALTNTQPPGDSKLPTADPAQR